MGSYSRRGAKRAVPQGTWLALLALAIQILLPFLVAYEIAFAGTPAHAQGTSVICSAAEPTNPTAPPQGSHGSRHGLTASCPICMALAAGQAFTAAAPIALPLPLVESFVHYIAVQTPNAPFGAIASYNPRAPPSIA